MLHIDIGDGEEEKKKKGSGLGRSYMSALVGLRCTLLIGVF